ncbi:MAG: DUF4824 family protein [Pseudomonadota bacterium]
MKRLLTSKALIAGVALILLTNLIVIRGALGNRAGSPDARLELTERELSLNSGFSRENSGIALRLNVQHSYRTEGSWLDANKLKTLGFHVPTGRDEWDMQRWAEKQLPRSVYIVLEFDGAAHGAAVQAARAQLEESQRILAADPDNKTFQNRIETNQRSLERLTTGASRLYSVDVGLDPVALRSQYRDRSSYIIAPGSVLPYYSIDDQERPQLVGAIQRIHVTKIHVPLEHRNVIDALLPLDSYGTRARLPRYKVTLAYGSRYEPWVESIDALEKVDKS